METREQEQIRLRSLTSEGLSKLGLVRLANGEIMSAKRAATDCFNEIVFESDDFEDILGWEEAAG